MKATLIISIYKNIPFLKAILDALTMQTIQDFEIIISEDGENPDVKSFIEQYHFNQPMKHLTQPDEGWRKNRALNRAILAATNPWLIFIDGDCILHPRFIEMHLKYAAPNVVLGGKRVKLGQTQTNQIFKDITKITELLPQLLKQIFFNQGESKYADEGIFINPYLPLSVITRFRKIRLLKGCNMSFSKETALLINGFDEDYTRPAIGEDTDLSWRFAGVGVKHISVRNLAVQYHLHHQESWHDQTENAKIRDTKRNQNLFICRNGITKHENI